MSALSIPPSYVQRAGRLGPVEGFVPPSKLFIIVYVQYNDIMCFFY